MPSGSVAKISARKKRWFVLCVVTSGLVLGLSSSCQVLSLHLPSAVGSPRSCNPNIILPVPHRVRREPYEQLCHIPLKQAELYWSVWAGTSGYLSEQLHITKLFAYTARGATIQSHPQNLFSVLSIVIPCFSWGNTKTKTWSGVHLKLLERKSLPHLKDSGSKASCLGSCWRLILF